MIIQNHKISISARKKVELFDITSKVKELILHSTINEGLAVIYSHHTTTGVTINENEERLMVDVEHFLEKIAPQGYPYLHDDLEFRDCAPDERINGHSHLKGLLLNTSELVIISQGELVLGPWQSIFFVEFDGSRERDISIKIMGE